MPQRFYSHGKLLLTGEYLVLDGATALALPTKFGQDLIVETRADTISWTSRDEKKEVWFKTEFHLDEIRNCLYSGEDPVRNNLLKILHEAAQLKPGFPETGFTVETNLEFPRFWGLGTSSTLIHNIALWLQIDPFKLSKNTMGGSGYDIACAGADAPITYRLANERPVINSVDFHPDFRRHLYFVYLNKKQNSRSAIASYYDKRQSLPTEIAKVNSITSALTKTRELANFTALLEEHEELISGVLQVPTVKQSLFRDFKGTLKSLGAWGGDFLLAVDRDDPSDYFRNKGFNTLLAYRDMIK